MSGHWESVFHPRSKPPQYTRIPTYRRRRTIGEERGGIFDCWEYTYYYVYVSDDMPSSDRFFELRIRVPLREWHSPTIVERVIAIRADEIMTSRGIDTSEFDKKRRGIRQVGTTNSRSGRYLVINKATRQSWPKNEWGSFRHLVSLSLEKEFLRKRKYRLKGGMRFGR